jgi:RecA-family ATPase
MVDTISKWPSHLVIMRHAESERNIWKELGPILKDKSIVELYAWRGVGKTYLSTAMGLAVAGAGKFLKWKAPRPRRVLYLDGEMAGDEFQGATQRID